MQSQSRRNLLERCIYTLPPLHMTGCLQQFKTSRNENWNFLVSGGDGPQQDRPGLVVWSKLGPVYSGSLSGITTTISIQSRSPTQKASCSLFVFLHLQSVLFGLRGGGIKIWSVRAEADAYVDGGNSYQARLCRYLHAERSPHQRSRRTFVESLEIQIYAAWTAHRRRASIRKYREILLGNSGRGCCAGMQSEIG